MKQKPEPLTRVLQQWGETAKFNGCSSVQLLYKIEDLCFDCPTIAKPRNVVAKSAPLFFFNLSAKRIFCSLIQSSFFSIKTKNLSKFERFPFYKFVKIICFPQEHSHVLEHLDTLVLVYQLGHREDAFLSIEKSILVNVLMRTLL